MSDQLIEQFRLLARVLFAVAILVLVLSIAGAIHIATSSSNVVLYSDIEHENRGTLALAAIGAGVWGSSVLAGLAAILTALLEHQRSRGRAPS